MEKILRDSVDEEQYFEELKELSKEGQRELNPLLPFIISGGKNTERYYFEHISKITKYKFRIEPEYFGAENQYANIFPEIIKAIQSKNEGATIFCVFDLDDIRKKGKTELEKFKRFCGEYVHNDSVIICHSMPSIEYWFLLHFDNFTELFKSCGPKSKLQRILSDYMKSFFPKTDKKLCNILKDETYVKNSSWVEKLCTVGNLDRAITSAEENIKNAIANNDLDNQSYTYVYRIFKEYR
ncbi:MAG: RloB domain-containing protein [Bacteroidales bacterium]|nr:RloB domain-containing protein [Bacteroidales bacterium]